MFRMNSLGQKLTSVIVGVLLVAFAVGSVVLNQVSDKLIREAATGSVESVNATMLDMVDVFAVQVEKGADRLMTALQFSIHEPLRLDTATTKVGERLVPQLRLGGKPLNLDFGLVDAFTRKPAAWRRCSCGMATISCASPPPSRRKTAPGRWEPSSTATTRPTRRS
jgi:methyl-accepting chemotaxis protein-2 (aspartate sensor receptor)